MANEAVSTKEKTKQNKPNVFDIFIEGARKGWTIGTQNLVPNITIPAERIKP